MMNLFLRRPLLEIIGMLFLTSIILWYRGEALRYESKSKECLSMVQNYKNYADQEYKSQVRIAQLKNDKFKIEVKQAEILNAPDLLTCDQAHIWLLQQMEATK